MAIRYDRLNDMDEEQLNYIEEVKLAWRQWQSTISFFENVTEPELVEVAIYSMEAAKRKYVYMINNVDKYLNENTQKSLLRYTSIPN